MLATKHSFEFIIFIITQKRRKGRNRFIAFFIDKRKRGHIFSNHSLSLSHTHTHTHIFSLSLSLYLLLLSFTCQLSVNTIFEPIHFVTKDAIYYRTFMCYSFSSLFEQEFLFAVLISNYLIKFLSEKDNFQLRRGEICLENF